MDDEYILYDFNPHATNSYFGNPYSDLNPNSSEAWDNLIDFDIDAFEGDTITYGLPSNDTPNWFDSAYGTLSNFASSSWDAISDLFTQSQQQAQANSSNNVSSINPLFIVVGALLLLKR